MTGSPNQKSSPPLSTVEEQEIKASAFPEMFKQIMGQPIICLHRSKCELDWPSLPQGQGS